MTRSRPIAGKDLTASERRECGKQFVKSLRNLAAIEAYFSPSTRRVVTRSTVITRAAAAMPDDAIFVGSYALPCVEAVFLDDLVDAIAAARFRAMQT